MDAPRRAPSAIAVADAQPLQARARVGGCHRFDVSCLSRADLLHHLQLDLRPSRPFRQPLQHIHIAGGSHAVNRRPSGGGTTLSHSSACGAGAQLVERASRSAASPPAGEPPEGFLLRTLAPQKDRIVQAAAILLSALSQRRSAGASSKDHRGHLGKPGNIRVRWTSRPRRVGACVFRRGMQLIGHNEKMMTHLLSDESIHVCLCSAERFADKARAGSLTARVPLQPN